MEALMDFLLCGLIYDQFDRGGCTREEAMRSVTFKQRFAFWRVIDPSHIEATMQSVSPHLHRYQFCGEHGCSICDPEEWDDDDV